MTGSESRMLQIGARVYWNEDKSDSGIVSGKDWSGVSIMWDSRGEQKILHNDMGPVTKY